MALAATAAMEVCSKEMAMEWKSLLLGLHPSSATAHKAFSYTLTRIEQVASLLLGQKRDCLDCPLGLLWL